VLPFCGGWLSLDPTDRTKLPSSEYPQGNHAVLGESAVIGSRVWDTSSAFEVQLGPLPAVQFKRLLPGQPQLRAIEDLLRFSVGPQYTINIRLILVGTELASCQLCEPAASSQVEPRLGWSCWLPTSAGANMERCDTVFESAQ
jgi:type VI secretion system protein ImpH